MGRKNKNPVADSTRGKSPVNNPKSYKGDVLVQVWVNSRILATLSEWLDIKGKDTRYLSEVVKIPLAVMTEFLIDSGEVNLIESTTEARNMLKSKYRVKLNAANRGRKNEQHNTLLDSISKSNIPIGQGSGVLNAEANSYLGATTPNPNAPKSNATIAREAWEEEERQERLARQLKRNEEYEYNEDGTLKITPHRNDLYKESDRIKDREIRKQREAEELMRLVEEGLDNKPKVKSDKIRPMTDAELDEKERIRAEKDKALYNDKW